MERIKSRVVVFLGMLLWALGVVPAGSATQALAGRGHDGPGLQCIHLPQLIDAYLKGHYSRKTLDDSLKANTVDQVIKSLDPSKTILLEEDVAGLRKSLPLVFSGIQKADCRVLADAYALVLKRVEENEAYVRQLLGKDYVLDDNAEVFLDPEKRSFPKTQQEKQAVLRGLVHFQISNYLLASMKLPQAKEQLVHRYELITKRTRERKVDAPIDGFAESFALALDPHSSYLSQDNLEDFQIQMHLSLEGIGASLSSEDGFTVIEETIPGGGAERSGLLRPKDKIISVAQDGQKPVNVMDMDLRDVVKLIRGKKGTKVTLTILRQAEKTETFDVAIVRDKIDIKDQAAKISYETRKTGGRTSKVAVIDLPSFYGGGGKGGRSCSADVRALLEEAKREKADGVVLNLSRNGGGLLDEAVKISGLFINRGGVVATKDVSGGSQVLADQEDGVVWKGPVVVLISRLSASASEILAGALQDYRRAIIVGSDHSFGKGSVQAVVSLPPGMGAMKVTTGMFFVPGGKSTQHSGINSDVVLPPVYATDDVGEKTLDYSLPPQIMASFVSPDGNTTALPSRWDPVDPSIVSALATRSRERVSKDPRFAEIKKELEESMRNRGVVKLSELRKKSAKEKEKEKAKEAANKLSRKEREQKIKDTEAPLINEAVNILVDWLEQKAAAPRTIQVSHGG